MPAHLTAYPLGLERSPGHLPSCRANTQAKKAGIGWLEHQWLLAQLRSRRVQRRRRFHPPQQEAPPPAAAPRTKPIRACWPLGSPSHQPGSSKQAARRQRPKAFIALLRGAARWRATTLLECCSRAGGIGTNESCAKKWAAGTEQQSVFAPLGRLPWGWFKSEQAAARPGNAVYSLPFIDPRPLQGIRSARGRRTKDRRPAPPPPAAPCARHRPRAQSPAAPAMGSKCAQVALFAHAGLCLSLSWRRAVGAASAGGGAPGLGVRGVCCKVVVSRSTIT